MSARRRTGRTGFPDDDLLQRSITYARRAGDYLHRWVLPSEMVVSREGIDFFTVGEFRAAAEVIHGLAMIYETHTENVSSTRILVGSSASWIDLIARMSSISRERVEQIVRLLTYRSQATRRGRLLSIASTPFFELGGDRLALSVTPVIWQDPQWALRALWKDQLAGDYTRKTAALGHTLAEEIGRIFADRRWATVMSKEVGVTDIDAGTGVPDDPFFLSCEAKAFIDDPLYQADDPKVWRQLARAMAALEGPQTFERVLGPLGLKKGDIRGAVVIPGHATPARGVHPHMTIVGVDDLRQLALRAQTPRELWTLLKSRETRTSLPTRLYQQALNGWTLECDAVDIEAIPRFVRSFVGRRAS